MKHIRKRRTFAQRPSPISLTSPHREVANRLLYSAHFRRDEPGNLLQGCLHYRLCAVFCQMLREYVWFMRDGKGRPFLVFSRPRSGRWS